MVQFCPKCGTKAPDDESAFCNKCGTRLPPVIPEKWDYTCPRCKAKAPDEQSVFCNKCGSPLQRTPPVQIQQAGARPAAAARPVMKKKNCPSCGAPLVDEISDYCNICGAYLQGQGPISTVPERIRENDQPHQEKTGTGTLVADIPDEGKEYPVKKKGWKSPRSLGIMAIVLIIFFLIIAAFISGMIPGMNQSSAKTPAPATTNQDSRTALPTQRTTKTTAPVLTTTHAKVTTTPVPTTVVKTNASAKGTSNASATVTTNVSAKATPNASKTVMPTLAMTDMSQPLSIGQDATDGKAKVTVNDFTFKDKLSDPVPSYAVGKKYLIVNITYENLQQNQTTDANTSGMLVKDGGGYTFEPASDGMLENPFNGKAIPPQQKRNGNMVYIVPPGATYLKFQYDFGNQIIATFQLT
jgi:hypothetical protein